MINWRKPVITSLLSSTGGEVLRALKWMNYVEGCAPQHVAHMQQERLTILLRHAAQHVPYYRETFAQAGVLVPGGEVDIGRFTSLPPLTKDVLMSRWDELLSMDSDVPLRRPKQNSSGGSTGEPVHFLQDQLYDDWNVANKLYFRSFAGQEIGEPEVRLWGLARDIQQLKEHPAKRAQNWLFNRRELNGFLMGESEMWKFYRVIQKHRPTWLEAYASSAAEFARFLLKHNLSLPPLNGVISSAGTLFDSMRQDMERAYQAPVLNRYGSREVGDMACTCPENRGLHLSVWNHVVELLDENMQPVGPGEMGNVHVTTLRNHTMPLIRYRIGDVASNPEPGQEICPCGRSTPLLASVEGRIRNMFYRRDGTAVSPHFFIHFVGVYTYDGSISKFQVEQVEYERIVIRVVPRDRDRFARSKPTVEADIARVMGAECRVDWREVDSIPHLPSGKFEYAVSRLAGRS